MPRKNAPTADPPTALVPVAPMALAPAHVVAGRARELRDAARSGPTRRAYALDWRHFTAWCDARGYEALPASVEALAAYVSELTLSYRPATIVRRLAGIRRYHKAAGLHAPTDAPEVLDILAGMRRTLRVAQAAKTPALTDDVRAMLAALPATLAGARDRALLLVGFAAALRRAELVALDVEHVTFTDDGARILIPQSKTDQEGRGQVVGIAATGRPTCPVAALRAWLERSGISSGPVFRAIDRHENVRPARLTSQVVALVVKRAALAAGYDPSRFAGHSLRAGFVTQAAANGASDADIMRTTRHQRTETLMRYNREGRLFHNNASSKLGL